MEDAGELERHMRRLIEIGIALSAERNLDRLLERILEEARSFTRADGGTLYLVHERTLRFAIVITDSLGIRMGGTRGPMSWPPVPLYRDDGRPNWTHVSAYVALTGKAVNIPDVYVAEGFNFEGTRRFDAGTGFRSTSMLVVPLRDHEDQIIGVLQLLNALDPSTHKPVPFRNTDEDLVTALASQAAVAITNVRLIEETERLFEAFVQVMASAIDERSPSTAGHIRRVTDLTLVLAEAINAASAGPFAGTRFSEDEMGELRIAALMHDVGKVTTPLHVVEKRTKLEGIFDRVELVRTRFELIKRTVEAEALRRRLHLAEAGAPAAARAALDAELAARLAELDEEQAFVVAVNTPVEFMPPEKAKRLRQIAAKTYVENGVTCPYLTEDELKNLAIQRGNITGDELAIMRDHAAVTIRLLEQIPFTRKLSRVPEIAGGHHEKLSGKGYPRGLPAERLPLQTRLIAVADVYEALVAADRPYKRARAQEEALKILGFMVKDGELDGEVVDLFIRSGAYKLAGKSAAELTAADAAASR